MVAGADDPNAWVLATPISTSNSVRVSCPLQPVQEEIDGELETSHATFAWLEMPSHVLGHVVVSGGWAPVGHQRPRCLHSSSRSSSTESPAWRRIDANVPVASARGSGTITVLPAYLHLAAASDTPGRFMRDSCGEANKVSLRTFAALDFMRILLWWPELSP